MFFVEQILEKNHLKVTTQNLQVFSIFLTEFLIPKVAVKADFT